MALVDSFLWMILTLVPLIWLQPRLHKEVQLLFLLLTRSAQMSILLFSVLFLPGVFLHEASHFLMAKLLRVRTGRFSIFPQAKSEGQLQMGYVEVAQSDPLRASLIGAAPLLAGMGVVAYIGLYQLNLDHIWASSLQGGLGDGLSAFFAVFHQQDVWLWLYLALAVSSTMFPSASDRRSWIWVAGIGVVLVFALVMLGGGTWLLAEIGPGLSGAFFAAAVVFGMSGGLHLLLLLPLLLLRRVLTDVLNVQIRYS